MRHHISSGLPMEERIGYSRAVRVDSTLYVSGTAPVDTDGKVVGQDTYEQAQYAFEKVDAVLGQAGYTRADAVMVRIYLADGADFEQAMRAYSEAYGAAKPAISVLNVLPFGLPGMLLEVELTAVRDDRGAERA
ncbi:Rid family hydrolase [Streptomyces sp. NPDC059837]|uniref:Rid family hydrolase n=1 Tax=unclassified Streptomyces TaxID=2593676 RepID=UPI0022587724|nr:Rid family hydrolase [Streptomyces sp. NBC_00365]MCX5096926.1 Rid family hydrolase [Streptomyces sp. NBC_00365]